MTASLFPFISTLSANGRRIEVLPLNKDIKIEDYLNGKDEVICCGGDGTLNGTVNAVLNSQKEKQIRIGYIPCGSTNDFARSVGIPLNFNNALHAFISGEEKEIDVGVWNNQKAFMYVASFGAFSSASYATPQDMKNSLGQFAYILSGLADVGKIKDFHVLLESDAATVSGQYCFGAVLNSTSLAGFVKLDKCQVDISDGLFEVFLVKNPRNLIELNSLITAVTTASFNSPLITFLKCKKCNFTFHNDTSWSIDGEEGKGGKSVEIRNEKRKIKMILPKGSKLQ